MYNILLRNAGGWLTDTGSISARVVVSIFYVVCYAKGKIKAWFYNCNIRFSLKILWKFTGFQ